MFLLVVLIALLYLILFLKIKSITKNLEISYSNNATKIFSKSEENI